MMFCAMTCAACAVSGSLLDDSSSVEDMELAAPTKGIGMHVFQQKLCIKCCTQHTSVTLHDFSHLVVDSSDIGALYWLIT